MARSVGVELGAVQTYAAQLEQLHLLGQFKHLQEQALELLQKAATERGDGVGVTALGDVAKRHRVVGGAFELAAREDAGGVAVDQDRQQGRRVVRFGAAPRLSPDQLGQIKWVDYFHYEARQMIFAQPIIHRRRQQVRRLSTHRHKLSHHSPPLVSPHTYMRSTQCPIVQAHIMQIKTPTGS